MWFRINVDISHTHVSGSAIIGDKHVKSDKFLINIYMIINSIDWGFGVLGFWGFGVFGAV